MWPRRKKRGREKVLRAYRQRRASARDHRMDAEPIVGHDATRARASSRRKHRRGGQVGRAGSGPRRMGRIEAPIGIAAELTSGWRRVPSRAVAAGMAFLLCLATAHLGLSSRYRVHGASAQVTGNLRLSTADVVTASGMAGRNVFTLDPHSIARSMEAHADLKQVRIASALPALVAIEVIESEVMLLLEQAGGRVGVDDQGRIVALPLDDQARPLVRDPDNSLAPNGVTIAPDLFHAARAYGQRFSSMSYREDEGFIAHTEEGWPVRLGVDESIVEAQLARLDALLSTLRDNGEDVEIIDLRFSSRPYYRLQGETP